MDIHESIDQIIASDEVLGNAFYEVFLKYPDVQGFFKDVNLKRQSVLLTMALLVVEQCEGGGAGVVNQYLRDLGAKHEEMGVPKDLYPYFCEAMLSTLETYHGDDWNDELQRQWSDSIERAANQMLRGYAQ